jgi:hypothetical protein
VNDIHAEDQKGVAHQVQFDAALNLVATALDSIQLEFVDSTDDDLQNCYGVAISSSAQAANSIKIKIVADLVVQNALPCLRATLLHEFCHAIRFYIYEQEFSNRNPPASPEKFRPKPEICRAYCVPDGQGELGLFFQQEMFRGTVVFRKGKCYIATDFTGDFSNSTRDFTSDELKLLGVPLPPPSPIVLSCRLRSGRGKSQGHNPPHDTPTNFLGETHGKCGILASRKGESGENDAWKFESRHVSRWGETTAAEPKGDEKKRKTCAA